MKALAFLQPRVQPAWDATRTLWALAALATWVPRGAYVQEAYSVTGIVVPSLFVPLAPLSLQSAWGHYVALIAGLLLVCTGRLIRLGTLLFLVPSALLLLHEGLNLKAYDRLLFFQGLVLLCAPGGGRSDRAGSPFAAHLLALVYIGLYASNGYYKLLAGEDWWQGTALAYALVDPQFGQMPLGVWLSGMPALTSLCALFTIGFELLFPLVWVPRLRPWLVLSAALFHAGTFVTMRLNTFELIALAGYPVLLGDRMWLALQARAQRLREQLGPEALLAQARQALPGAVPAIGSRVAVAALAGSALFGLDRVVSRGSSTLDAGGLVSLWALHVGAALLLILLDALWLGLVHAHARLRPEHATPLAAGALLALLAALPVHAVSSELTSGAWIARQAYAGALALLLFTGALGLLIAIGALRNAHGHALRDRITERLRQPAVYVLGLLTLAVAAIDAWLLPGLYPSFHRALYVASAVLTLLAAGLWLQGASQGTPQRSARAHRVLGTGAVSCALVASIALLPAERGALVVGSHTAALVLPLLPRAPSGAVIEALTYMRLGRPDARPTSAPASDRTGVLGDRTDYNVLLVLTDTLRADALPFESAQAADVAPFLHRFLKGTFRFRNVYSQASCTRPSLLPTFRSVHTSDDAAVTGIALGARARELGMLPLAIVPPYIESDASELLTGFEQVVVYEKEHQEVVVERARELLAALNGQRFFAWVHFYALHAPYFAGRPTTSADGSTRERYLMALRWLDTQLEQLFASVSSAGLDDDTVIVLAADHGESLGEEGKHGHGTGVTEREVRVPLALRIPGQANRSTARSIETFVSNIDLVPTLLSLAGAPPDKAHRGRNLLPVIAGEDRTTVPLYFESSTRDTQGIALGPDKLVRSPSGTFHRYDTAKDPEEKRDLYGQNPTLERELRGAMLRKNPKLFADELQSPDARSLLVERLRAVKLDALADADLELLLRLATLSADPEARKGAIRLKDRARDPDLRALASATLRLK